MIFFAFWVSFFFFFPPRKLRGQSDLTKARDTGKVEEFEMLFRSET